jgi:hypothetical protein
MAMMERGHWRSWGSVTVFSAFLALALGFGALGCNDQKPPPLYASSSGQTGYASRYPETMASERGRIAEHEGASRRMMASFATYPDELKDPDWNGVKQVVDLADSAGQSAAYVERREEVEATERFFADQKDEITKSVAGAAQYTAKQKNCDVDTYGSAAHALEKSVEKGLEKYLRERNEAHAYIEDNQDSLGKPNLEKLRKQADDISYVSYMAHVGIPKSKRRIEEMVAEASDVKSTLDRTVEESKKVEADPARSAADKAAAKKRGEAAAAAKTRVDSEIQQAQHVLEGLEEKHKQLLKEYDEALDGLRKKIDEKAQAQPKKA